MIHCIIYCLWHFQKKKAGWPQHATSSWDETVEINHIIKRVAMNPPTSVTHHTFSGVQPIMQKLNYPCEIKFNPYPINGDCRLKIIRIIIIRRMETAVMQICYRQKHILLKQKNKQTAGGCNYYIWADAERAITYEVSGKSSIREPPSRAAIKEISSIRKEIAFYRSWKTVVIPRINTWISKN